MKIESKETTNPRGGIARHWRIGPVLIRWYVESPPQDWLKFDGNLTVQWFNE